MEQVPGDVTNDGQNLLEDPSIYHTAEVPKNNHIVSAMAPSTVACLIIVSA